MGLFDRFRAKDTPTAETLAPGQEPWRTSGAWAVELVRSASHGSSNGYVSEHARHTFSARITEVLGTQDQRQLRHGGLAVQADINGLVRRRHGGWIEFGSPVTEVLGRLARRRPGWTVYEVGQLWTLAAAARVEAAWDGWALAELYRLPVAAAAQLDDAGRARLTPLVDDLLAVIADVQRRTTTDKEFVRKVGALRSTADDDALPPGVLTDDDGFAPALLTELVTSYGVATVAAVLRVFGAYPATAVAPTKAWRKTVRTCLDEHPETLDVARTVATRVSTLTEDQARQNDAYTWVLIGDGSVVVARAAVWTLAIADEPVDAAPLLGAVGLVCGTGWGGSGGVSRCLPVASSVVAGLAELGPELSVPQLSLLQDRIPNKTLRKSITKALRAVALASGLTPAQLLERSVPTFDLDRDGTDETRLGEHTARLAVTSAGGRTTVTLTWVSSTGRAVASVPKAVHDVHPAELAELRARAKGATKALATQRARVESLLAADGSWTGADWQQYYVDHPLVGVLARALLWELRAPTGWVAGRPERHDDAWVLVGVDGATTAVADTDELRLWHPIRVPADDVRQWREVFTEQERRQPFKQVFREVYLLTPAEQITGAYSNRFAAHILRYPQAGALIRARGWSGNHLGPWDGGYDGDASKEFADGAWRAHFYYSLVDDGDISGGVELCSTDQVRFGRATAAGRGDWSAADVADVPPLVFSEAMRDVDLFVGVTSIAADPEWTDSDERGHRDYWNRTSFGDLTESAEVRRDALRRLIPRTKIASRARVTDRYLEVDGSLHTYKIHLGSGNILMSPNDRYLCIVTGRSTGPKKVFLPFEEGGGLLSTIVSKAFLLADDVSITDETILQQIR